MEPRNVPVTKGRDLMEAGWTPAQAAEFDGFVQVGGWPHGAVRQTARNQAEVAFGRAVDEAAASAGKAPRWLTSGPRLDVVGNGIWSPIVRSIPSRFFLKMSRPRWDRIVKIWTRAGYTFRDDPTMVTGWRPYVESLNRATEAPVPYCHFNTVEKIVEIYGFCLDVRLDGVQDYVFGEYERMAAWTGTRATAYGYKSGPWGATTGWPSHYVDPYGTHTLDPRRGWTVDRDISSQATIITLGHYAPGEFQEATMKFLRRLIGAGFRVLLNEAYADQGVRWLWADEFPDVAAMLIGEGVYRDLGAPPVAASE